MPSSSSDRKADYLNVPDHSDLRGFSYRAPARFDYRDELPRAVGAGFWEKLKAAFLRDGRR